MAELIIDLKDVTTVLLEKARKPNIWSLGNEVLYKFCREYPTHQTSENIVGKFWLIGRSYAAAVERRRTSNEIPPLDTNTFYENRLVPAVKQADFDTLFQRLDIIDTPTELNLDTIVEIHYQFTKTLEGITYQWKRSLASKYLHFHYPHLFFIYDSYAHEFLKSYVPNWSSRRLSEKEIQDKVYYKFCSALIEFRDEIQSEFNQKLSPRELDNLLLKPWIQKKVSH